MNPAEIEKVFYPLMRRVESLRLKHQSLETEALQEQVRITKEEILKLVVQDGERRK